jgi:hypothetical protein
MLHLLVKFSSSYFFLIILFIGTYPLLISCRGNLGEPNCGEFLSSTCFKFNLTKDPAIFPSSRSFSLTKNSSSFSSAQPEASASPRTPQVSSQLNIQQSLLEPEKLPSPTQEARNDVSMNTYLSILFIQ